MPPHGFYLTGNQQFKYYKRTNNGGVNSSWCCRIWDKKHFTSFFMPYC